MALPHPKGLNKAVGLIGGVITTHYNARVAEFDASAPLPTGMKIDTAMPLAGWTVQAGPAPYSYSSTTHNAHNVGEVL